MRIGHYAPYLWTPGGISTYVHRLGAAQEAHNHEVVYFSRHANGRACTVEVADDDALFDQAAAYGVDVLHLHKSVDRVPPSSLPVLRTMHGHQGSCPSASRYLARTEQPCSRVPSVGGCLWGHLADRCGSARPGVIVSDFARLRREVDFAAAVRTLTVSDYLRDRMIDAGCPAHQVQTLHSPAPSVADPAGPVDRSAPPRFLFLGRLAPQKGLMWLLRAFAAVETDAHLDIAGEGTLLDAAQTFVQQSGLTDRVTFHGWVEADAVPALMAAARAVVFPSIWHEPAGLVSLEAAAHGRALIASRVGGIPEYAAPLHALLVPPNDTLALARAITDLAQAPDRADRLGRLGRAAVTSCFALDHFLDRLDLEYQLVRPAPTRASRLSLVTSR